MAIDTMHTRAQIAVGANAVVSGRLAYFDFEAAISNELKADPLIDELLDLILHEPAFGGLLSSTSERDHAQYMKRVHEIIELLRQSQT
jgi:hypothetical protein